MTAVMQMTIDPHPNPPPVGEGADAKKIF